MGNSDTKSENSEQQAEQIPTDPLINRLRSAFRLSLSQKDPNKTHSFIHSFFSQQILKANAQKINPNFSPFCSATFIQANKTQIATCSLISPILAIASAQKLSNEKDNTLHKKLNIIGMQNNFKHQIHVKTIIQFKKYSLILLLLERPIWKLGWCGLSFLQQSKDINELSLYSIKNTQQLAGTSKAFIEQSIFKVFVAEENNFKGKSVKNYSGLLFQIIERKPYIVGVQRQFQAFFFDHSTILALQHEVNNLLTFSAEKHYLKSIDLQQMEIQTSW